MGARLTPYEVAFGVEQFEADTFPAIRGEADARHVETDSRDRFLMLGTVGSQLRELRPDPDAGEAEADTTLPPPDAVRQYGALLFHAYRFWDAGRQVLTIDASLVRQLLADGTVGEWRFEAPGQAGYVQLPRHLFWARIDDEAPAEAVDGFFWSTGGQAAGQGRFELLLVLGMHPSRPGFSVIEAAAPLPAPAPGHWGDEDARPGVPDFDNILPGGEMRQLLAIVSTAELLKLVSRIFHHIAVTPGALKPARAGGQPEPPESAHTLAPSALESREIT